MNKKIARSYTYIVICLNTNLVKTDYEDKLDKMPVIRFNDKREVFIVHRPVSRLIVFRAGS